MYQIRDLSIVEQYETDPLIHRKVTARCGQAIMEAIHTSMTLAHRIKIPCLILHAGADAICDPVKSQDFAKKMGDKATFHRYDGLYHELFNEPERMQVIDDLCLWMNKLLGNPKP